MIFDLEEEKPKTSGSDSLEQNSISAGSTTERPKSKKAAFRPFVEASVLASPASSSSFAINDRFPCALHH